MVISARPGNGASQLATLPLAHRHGNEPDGPPAGVLQHCHDQLRQTMFYQPPHDINHH
jgi:hypothetical protein